MLPFVFMKRDIIFVEIRTGVDTTPSTIPQVQYEEQPPHKTREGDCQNNREAARSENGI